MIKRNISPGLSGLIEDLTRGNNGEPVALSDVPLSPLTTSTGVVKRKHRGEALKSIGYLKNDHANGIIRKRQELKRTFSAADSFAKGLSSVPSGVQRKRLLSPVRSQLYDLSGTAPASIKTNKVDGLTKRHDGCSCDRNKNNYRAEGHRYGHHSSGPHHHGHPHRHRPERLRGDAVGHQERRHGHEGSAVADINLKLLVDTKIQLLVEAYVDLILKALVNVKADISTKILLKLGIDVNLHVDLALRIKALVDAKVDAAVAAYLNTDIRINIGDIVRGHCHSYCSNDVDNSILADIATAIKVELGNILIKLDADILADIQANLLALGVHLKVAVDVALGLNLGSLLGGILGSCREAEPSLLAELAQIIKTLLV
ncbi:hypothetical protein BGW42_002079 [Actinomortierella wolfii]|nr:hypothetical protein BGW42_002079 [Actinomortierella wolfii]